MKVKILVGIASCAFFFACNNSPKEVEENTTTSEMEGMEGQESAPINTTVEIRSDQNVFFPNLEDGQEITLPFIVQFGVKGMDVEPAGPINADKGHHHLYIDAEPTTAGEMVPMGKEAEGFMHFGKAQTADTLNIKKYPTLTKGKHTLTLQFGNGGHISYGPAMSKTINITVK